MSKKLHYFNLNGFAECIRYILHYSGEKFEDIRYDHSKWPIASVKNSLPFGQLPLYEEDGRTLNQSLAIARYVAIKANLLPSDPWEQANLDAITSTIYDFWNNAYPFFKEEDPVKKKDLKRIFLSETLVYYFSRFEKTLEDNNGYFNGKLSWADFVLVGIVEIAHLLFDTEVEKEYPAITALVNKIRSLPGVKEYIATREPYSLSKSK